jgi:3-dehydroquinate synthase
MTTLTVRAPSREYDIAIGEGAIDGLIAVFDALPRRAAVVTDENVRALHGDTLSALLARAGVTYTLRILPPGEATKTLDTAALLYHDFTAFSLHRGEPVIAFGGGVVGDVAGFAAATYMRGVPLVQIPTTIVAQLDSSVGGKTGVNLGEGKNLVGCFYQPVAVLSDTALLRTLPPRETNAGLAEAIKYALLGELELIPILFAPGDTADMERLVYLSTKRKSDLVERDERDTGARMALNLGHTFGHAIEKYYDYKRYNHGEAVAKGLYLAVNAGIALGITPESVRDVLDELLRARALDWSLDISARELVPLMAGDKKNEGDTISLILLKDIGEPVVRRISPAELAAIL